MVYSNTIHLRQELLASRSGNDHVAILVVYFAIVPSPSHASYCEIESSVAVISPNVGDVRLTDTILNCCCLCHILHFGSMISCLSPP
jgi:hypothetical protein